MGCCLQDRSSLGLRDQVATAVAQMAFEQGVAGIAKPEGRLEDYIRSKMWAPE